MRKGRDNDEGWRRRRKYGGKKGDRKGRRGKLVCKAGDRPETDLTPSSRFLGDKLQLSPYLC